jgi:hypothetical protein
MLPSIALVMFLAVSCVGLYMGARLVRNHDVAVQIVQAHGLAAAVGIGVLLHVLSQNQVENFGAFALVLFMVTACGGVVLQRLAKKLSNKPKELT